MTDSNQWSHYLCQRLIKQSLGHLVYRTKANAICIFRQHKRKQLHLDPIEKKELQFVLDT